MRAPVADRRVNALAKAAAARAALMAALLVGFIPTVRAEDPSAALDTQPVVHPRDPSAAVHARDPSAAVDTQPTMRARDPSVALDTQPAVRARDPSAAVDTQPAVRALNGLRRAWFGQLNELISATRAFAVADDTYEFMSRPNIPYVQAHYDRAQLAADGIDTVLIVDRHGNPLLWRNSRQRPNRGFPDARAFLAELPPLPAAGVSGVPSFAGAATLSRGPTLVVAMPIYESSGSRGSPGWVIATRALDAIQWSRYEELASIPVQLLDPLASDSSHDVSAALNAPLAPIVRVENNGIRGLMAVMDLQGKPFRVFSILLAGRHAGLESAAVSLLARSGRWLALAGLILSGAVVAFAVWGDRRHHSAKVRLGVRPIDSAAAPRSEDPAPPPGGPARAAATETSLRDRLQTRLAASNPVFRYQPQIDLRTGQVAGVESLLCVPGLRQHRPATDLVADIEAAGLGLALAERQLQEACRQQQAWVREIGHDFPIGVPVSQRTVANTAFLPIVRRILAETELAPSLLELEIEEIALGASATALRTFTRGREAGLSIAINGFNAAHSNLRLLTILPISKLRIDPWLLLRIGDEVPEALLFDGILGAARGLGIAVCATGVDTPEIYNAVLRHGRPLAQGSSLGAPLDGDQFLELLGRSRVDTATLAPLDLSADRLLSGMS